MVPKFRAYDTKNKVMVTNFHRSHMKIETGKVLYQLNTTNENEIKAIASYNTFDDYIYRYSHDLELMQSTGLKDKNGVEIFEGDILIYTAKSVNYSDTYWHSYCEVFRAPNGAYRIRGEHIYETDLYSNRNHVTVAGNIYDTPELLKKERLMTSTADPELLEAI